jgi:TolB protein
LGLLVVLSGCAGKKKFDPPVVTDEFDLFLVTKATQIGDAIGRINLVFPNSKKVAWSLVPPVPGGDRRNYLKEGQMDATAIVEIDPRTAEVRLKARPASCPAHYYAEVRAANEDGFMEQVLIIVALEETPRREHALDIFTQRIEGSGMSFYATAGVDPKKIEYAAKVAEALLSKDRKGSGKITLNLKRDKWVMTLFKTYEERNTSIGFFMHSRSLGMRDQDLEDEEIIPDYLRLGGPANLRRDASVEEITHVVHEGGIMEAYPEVQKRLEKATQDAIDRKLFRPWDGLPADSFSYEYLAIGLDIYYGVFQNKLSKGRLQDENGNPMQPAYRLSINNDVLMTADNLKKYDPELYEIVSFLFPTREEFFGEMGWGLKTSKIIYLAASGNRRELFSMDEDGSGKRRLADLAFSVEWPSWSPDGKSIMFVSYDGSTRGLYLIDRGGINLRKVGTGAGFPDTPCWSHDGRKIAYTAEGKEGRSIEIIDIDGANPKAVAGNGIHGGYQSWSPVEPLLVFESGRDGNPEIYTIRADSGENLKRLTDNEQLDEWPCFSRDGSMIAWSHGIERDKDLWVMNADGSHKRRLTQNLAIGDSFPSFSPDGSRVVFVSGDEGHPPSIYVVHLDGSGLKKIAEGSSPNWSPGY